MSALSLEITYRKGRPVAAYLYLPRHDEDRVARSERREAGFVVDYSADERPIGIEITAPSSFNLASLNRVLESVGQPAADAADIVPLQSSGS